MEDDLFAVISVFSMGHSFWISLIYGFIALILLALSGIISGAEVSFFSLSPKDIDHAKKDNTKQSQRVIQILLNPKKLLATILITNNLANVSIVIILAYLTNLLLPKSISESVKILIDVVGITFVLLLFGEVLPKVYANRNALSFSQFVSLPLSRARAFFSFLSIPLLWINDMIEKTLGKQKSNITISHLEQALEITSDQETTEEERKILEGIVSFGTTEASQVMTPRVDVFSLKEKTSFAKVLHEITKKGYSRIPVFKERVDQITGILYAKDMLPFLEKNKLNWSKLKRKPIFVPENKKIDDLLREFQEKKIHMAIVVDEYGGTSGIITLEDIIEEIVGEISDEYDDVDFGYTKLDAHNYLIEGKLPLIDFYKIAEIENEEVFEEKKGEAETLAGFVLEMVEGIPKVNQIIRFGRCQFKIKSVDKKRIKTIQLTILEEIEKDEPK